jgi:hypothetical protein
MNRWEAMRRANVAYGTRELDSGDTRFANISKGPKKVWWVDIPLSKISTGGLEEVNLLLCDGSNKLHHLRVPSQYFRQNRARFVVQPERKCISLELSADGPNMFQDLKLGGGRAKFAQFWQRRF